MLLVSLVPIMDKKSICQTAVAIIFQNRLKVWASFSNPLPELVGEE
jgi:hypothetical protein